MSMDKLVAAMATANGKVPHPKKTNTNAAYDSKYADVADVEAAVRPVWASHGLSWRYDINTEPGHLVVALVVLHESGQTLHLPGLHATPPADPQKLVSVTTYYKRLVLSAAAGVSADDDDDGNQASAPEANAATDESPRQSTQAASDAGKRGSGAVHTDGPKRGPQADAPMTDAQRRRLWATARAKGYGDKPTLVSYAAGQLGWTTYAENRLSQLTKAEASKLIDALQTEVLAERLDQPPEDDPWYGKDEQTVMS